MNSWNRRAGSWAEAQLLENERLPTLENADERLPLLTALQKLSSPAA